MEIPIKPQPLKWQAEVMTDPSRFKVLACGRRAGKTVLGTVQCLQTAGTGGRAWWVAPTYPVAAIGWRAIKEMALRLPGTEKQEANRRVVLSSGGEVQVKSADNPDSLRGEGLDLVVVDEAAFVKEEAWTGALRPALSDRQGRALFISTPRGRNYFYHLWTDAQDKPDWSAFRFPTSANPHITPEEIQAAKDLLPALIFAQEYEALFTEQFGAMFKREWFGIVDRPPVGAYVRYWDLAASPEGDYSVGAKAALVDGKLIIADVVRGRWAWPELRRIIASTAIQDGPDVRVGIEKAAFQLAAVQDVRSLPELARITVRGIPVRSASAAVKALYANLPTDKAAKAARCAPWLARAEAGEVVLVRASWNGAWLSEITDFPMSGVPDDQVDAVSGAVAMLATRLSIWADMPMAEDEPSKWRLGGENIRRDRR